MRTHVLVLGTMAAGLAYTMAKHDRSSEPFFPLMFGLAAAAGAGGAGAVGIMNSGAKWSGGAIPTDKVSFFKDDLFRGSRADFPVGTEQRSLSKGYLRTGLNKENDTYTSLIVPAGMQVWLYTDNDFQGKIVGPLGPGRYPNLGTQFGINDMVSSVKVQALAPAADVYPRNPACNPGPPGGSYTTRVLVNGRWVCPAGYTDTRCSWGDPPNERNQCRKN